MNEEEMIARIWKYSILGTVALFALFIGSCQTTKYRIVEAVEAGASVLEADCALSSNTSIYGCMLLYDAEAEHIRGD